MPPLDKAFHPVCIFALVKPGHLSLFFLSDIPLLYLIFLPLCTIWQTKISKTFFQILLAICVPWHDTWLFGDEKKSSVDSQFHRDVKCQIIVVQLTYSVELWVDLLFGANLVDLIDQSSDLR